MWVVKMILKLKAPIYKTTIALLFSGGESLFLTASLTIKSILVVQPINWFAKSLAIGNITLSSSDYWMHFSKLSKIDVWVMCISCIDTKQMPRFNLNIEHGILHIQNAFLSVSHLVLTQTILSTIKDDWRKCKHVKRFSNTFFFKSQNVLKILIHFAFLSILFFISGYTFNYWLLI